MYYFDWVENFVVGASKKTNYRKKDGQRLTASEYRARRKKEIILHLTLLISTIIFITVGSVFVVKTISNHLKDSKQAVESAADSSLPVDPIPAVDTIITEAEAKEEEENPYLEKSDDSTSFFEGYNVKLSDDTGYISSENVLSNYGVLVNLDSGEAVASKDGNVRINPASMTKILTLLVAVEHLDNIDNTFTMTQEIGDFVYSHDCSAVGFKVGEVLTIKDLLYGTILPSGGDAAMCLAEYVAGSQEAFVDLMNDKLKELGLSDTAHFTNCIGIYDENHYCTLTDMAMILKAAEENKLCHEILNARTYLTSSTNEHPEGIQISNWFLRRIEDKDTHGEVIGAKTGFVNEAGCCGASYMISNDGTHYICVTADAWSSWRCIYDHVDIYDTYAT